MKKLLILMLSLLMILTLAACSSAPKEEVNNRPIKTVSFFGKDYSTPVTLEKLIADGVEPKVVFLENVSAGEVENVFLSKDGEYVRVGVYNPGESSASVTDPSMVISYILMEYNDSYVNAAEIPSCKIEGVGIADELTAYVENLGEPETAEIMEGVYSKTWSWDEENCAIVVVEAANAAYAIEAWLPKE